MLLEIITLPRTVFAGLNSGVTRVDSEVNLPRVSLLRRVCPIAVWAEAASWAIQREWIYIKSHLRILRR